jgi:hypothetical protein
MNFARLAVHEQGVGTPEETALKTDPNNINHEK